ncbi:MAG TPA: hypothetical protein DEH78_24835, partial [Solibacterales bacterium]|nr:hypothetical protein [Bryobacterales bacterium]
MFSFRPGLILALGAIVGSLPGGQALDPGVARPLREGRHAEALARADALVARAPNDPALWTARGFALAGLGRTEESLNSFDRALRVSPGFAAALRGGADTAYRARSPRAPGFLDRLLKAAPGDATAHAMAAVLAFERGECSAALPHFGAARAMVERDPLAASQFAQCLVDTGRATEAVAVLRTARDANPASADAAYNLGVALRAAGRRDEAAGVLAGQTLPAAMSFLGVLHAEAGDLQRALPLLER